MDDLSTLSGSLPLSQSSSSSLPDDALLHFQSLQIMDEPQPASPSLRRHESAPLNRLMHNVPSASIDQLMQNNQDLQVQNQALSQTLQMWQQRCSHLSRRMQELVNQHQESTQRVQEAEARIAEEINSRTQSDEGRRQMQMTLEHARNEQERLRRLVQDSHIEIHNLRSSLQQSAHEVPRRQHQQQAEAEAEESQPSFRQLCRDGWLLSREDLRISDRVIGRGAYGSVHLAEWRGCNVAVKCIHDVIISDYNRSVFEREMYMYSLLSHPHLVKCYGASIDNNGTPLIIMEAMDCSLRALLTRSGALPFEHCVSLAAQVASALFYLHGLNPKPVVHRDISSANILLSSDGNIAKISDFGSAQFLADAITSCPGAAIYTAPEIISGRRYSTHSDMFAFGVLLCEMCSGRIPDPRRRLDQIETIASRNLRMLAQRCICARTPQQRPSAAATLSFLRELANRFGINR